MAVAMLLSRKHGGLFVPKLVSDQIDIFEAFVCDGTIFPPYSVAL